MATSSSRSTRATELHTGRRWKDRETSPERTKVWTEPAGSMLRPDRKVAVVYYLSRNGQLEHPHFIEVSLSSPDGLYLKDVINRLNSLRGKAMASMYSWSCKRSYKNGFVWHDLEEDDFIHPAHGQEYVLKGSEILEDSPGSTQSEETSFSSSKNKTPESRNGSGFPAVNRRRYQSWSSSDFHKVYKADSSGELSERAAADASTQTEDRRRRRRSVKIVGKEDDKETHGNDTTELRRDEISPPPSDSSPETLETLMKADGRVLIRPETITEADEYSSTPNQNEHQLSRGKANARPSILMQLLSCGSMSFKDCGPVITNQYKPRLTRGGEMGENNQVGKDAGEATVECLYQSRVNLEDKEYFSGSLIMETKKDEFAALKRSSSYNADRSCHMEMAEKEEEGGRAKCIPRKPKTSGRKESKAADLVCSGQSTPCNSLLGSSKRAVVQPPSKPRLRSA